MTAPRRLLAAVLAMVALVAFALLLWRWLPGPLEAAPQSAAVPVAPAAVIGARPPTSSPRSPPRLQPMAAVVEQSPPPMPEGLAQDLEMFDGVQLKAELESIALSHPEVRVVEAACTGLPCRAQATSTSAEQLKAFAQAVHQRFQGHVSMRTERLPGEMRATFWVGTTPEPLPDPP